MEGSEPLALALLAARACIPTECGQLIAAQVKAEFDARVQYLVIGSGDYGGGILGLYDTCEAALQYAKKETEQWKSEYIIYACKKGHPMQDVTPEDCGREETGYSEEYEDPDTPEDSDREETGDSEEYEDPGTLDGLEWLEVNEEPEELLTSLYELRYCDTNGGFSKTW